MRRETRRQKTRGACSWCRWTRRGAWWGGGSSRREHVGRFRPSYVIRIAKRSRASPRPFVAPRTSRVAALRTGLLLLLAEQRGERHTRHLHHLETDAGDIADGVSLTAETRNEHLVVLVHEVQATVSGDERRDLLAVLDELHADALTNGGVRLLRLDAELLQDDALGVRASGEGLLPLRTEVRLVVILVRPAVFAAKLEQLTTGSETTSLTVGVYAKGEGEGARRSALGARSGMQTRAGKKEP